MTRALIPATVSRNDPVIGQDGSVLASFPTMSQLHGTRVGVNLQSRLFAVGVLGIRRQSSGFKALMTG